MTRNPVTLAAAAVLLLALTGCVPSATARAAAIAATPAAATVRAIHLPAHPTVYFFGDSWTQGSVAAPKQGYAYVVGRALGWKVRFAPDGSGTGFVHNYAVGRPLFLQRAKALPRIHADLIVLQGGLNDQPGPLTHFWTAVRLTVETLRKKSHGAPIVMLGPASPTGTVGEGLSAIDYEEAGVAAQLHVPYISPTKEHWINPANVRDIIDPKTFHPTTRGHAYFGARVAQALEELVR